MTPAQTDALKVITQMKRKYNLMMITMAKAALEFDSEIAETIEHPGTGLTKAQLNDELFSREACMIRVRDMLIETMEDSDSDSD
tara:strand:+ start:133 stop:384 length:252 start_codon:yes stop_codon:yes gene_type:complete